MSDIKPIQTEYKGYKFRSRLEARWAVFFDACGVDWEYEPEGYDLGNGLYYLPDFVLHDVLVLQDHSSYSVIPSLYVEVKGEMSELDLEKIKRFSSVNPVVVVGYIPYEDEWHDLVADMHDGCDFSEQGFWSFRYINGNETLAIFHMQQGNQFCLYDFDNDHNVDVEKTLEAYKKARQARFEHGENPVF